MQHYFTAPAKIVLVLFFGFFWFFLPILGWFELYKAHREKRWIITRSVCIFNLILFFIKSNEINVTVKSLSLSPFSFSLYISMSQCQMVMNLSCRNTAASQHFVPSCLCKPSWLISLFEYDVGGHRDSLAVKHLALQSTQSFQL